MKCASSESIELLFDANLFHDVKITGFQVWDTKQNKTWDDIDLENILEKDEHLFERFQMVRLKLQPTSLKANCMYNIRIIVDDPESGKPIVFTKDRIQTKGKKL